MTRSWADFIGWQYFANKRGWMPLFRLYIEPPTIQNGTTVGLETLRRYEVSIPNYPPFKPNTQVKSTTMFYCSCGLTFVDKKYMIIHIKDTKDGVERHRYSMEVIKLADLPDTGRAPQAEVVRAISKPQTHVTPQISQVLIQATKEAEESAKNQLKQALTEEDTQELKEDEESPEDWARSMYQRFDIPLPKRLS